jgi:hypothetical protein
MRKFTAFVAALLMLPFAGIAYAAQLISPPLWSEFNNSAACYIRNTGGSPVSVQVKIYSNFGPDDPLTPVFQNCNNAPLPAGRTCAVLVSVSGLPDSSFVGCMVTGNALGKIRGTLEIREATPGLPFRVTVAEDLR